MQLLLLFWAIFLDRTGKSFLQHSGFFYRKSAICTIRIIARSGFILRELIHFLVGVLGPRIHYLNWVKFCYLLCESVLSSSVEITTFILPSLSFASCRTMLLLSLPDHMPVKRELPSNDVREKGINDSRPILRTWLRSTWCAPFSVSIKFRTHSSSLFAWLSSELFLKVGNM